MERSALRRGVLAYLIGAGIVGTLLVGPYGGRYVSTAIFPALRPAADSVPFFLLPIAWGLWNWWYVRRQPRIGIGAWGALLGLLLVAGVQLLLTSQGLWFAGAMFLFLTIPAGYYLLWSFVVGPINDLLGL